MNAARAKQLPAGVERNQPLVRLTTVRTGGAAELFARPGSVTRLVELLAWAHGQTIPVAVIGSGSNLLISDQGVKGLVLKLDGRLTETRIEGQQMICGGGARLPRASAQAAARGLAGIEFGVNIPGTVGGAVRMNANAYGGELARVLDWVDVATPAGRERREPGDLGFSYRKSNLTDYEIVSRVQFKLKPERPQAVKRRLADLRDRRKAAQPSGIKTFGSTFKNPDDSRAAGATAGQLLEAAGCKGLQIGGARFSPKHANFIENRGDATTADIVELIAAGRTRVKERSGVRLETEVQVLGPVGDDLWKGA